MLVVYAAGAAVACIMLATFAQSGHFIKSAFASALSGFLGLAAAWGAGFFGLQLVILNLASVLTAAVLGLPGVIGLMLMRLIV